MLIVEVVPADGQEIEQLEFRWNVTNFSDQYIEFQLNFTDALYVSRQKEADLLSIKFNDPDIFVSQTY